MSAQKFTAQALVKDLGLISYEDGYREQERRHAAVLSGHIPAAILVLEHKPVLTLGKHADPSFILSSAEKLEREGVERVSTDRGGEVTAHMPGQIVMYPILPLTAMRLQPRAYVDVLLKAVIATLAKFGIQARCSSEFPGVWVGDKKICAVGVRIRERVSLHGIALNVNNSLDLFRAIVPCGIRHLGVTSMAQESGKEVDMSAVRHELLIQLGLGLGLELISDDVL